MTEDSHRNALPTDYRLHWYQIKKILGQGGFGITYLARDLNLDEDVAIKEYLPIELAVRDNDSSVHPVSTSQEKQFKWGLTRFIDEARTLAKFKHPHIVRVRSVFEENQTAYMVMEYEHGESLQDILSDRKTIPQDELLRIILPILDGLESVHEVGFIHRDIKPANIFIRTDGIPVLLDFGSARQALGIETKTLTSLVTPGYAPFEQYYSRSDEQGPWTDIYGLSATLYRAIAGRPPLDAVDRSKAILNMQEDAFTGAGEIGQGKYSPGFLNAVDHGLKFKSSDRPQTIAAWREQFMLAQQEEIPTGVPMGNLTDEDLAPTTDSEALTELSANEDRRRSIPGYIMWSVGLFLLLAIALLIFNLKSFETETSVATNEAESTDVQVVNIPINDNTPEPLPAETDVVQKKNVTDEVAIEDKIEPEPIVEEPDVISVDELISQARADIIALRLSSPADNNALQKIETLENIEPGNDISKALRTEVASKYLSLARQSLQQFEKDGYETYLGKARDIGGETSNYGALIKLSDLFYNNNNLEWFENNSDKGLMLASLSLSYCYSHYDNGSQLTASCRSNMGQNKAKALVYYNKATKQGLLDGLGREKVNNYLEYLNQQFDLSLSLP